MDKPKFEKKEEVLAKKREKEKLRYQKIRENPELYAEYQRKNKLKYENRKALEKIVPINKMTPHQQKLQREKWREERKRRYQRMKDKDNKSKSEKRQEILALKKERPNVGYQIVMDNPELNLSCKRENKIIPERNQAQIKIVPVHEIATQKERENAGDQIINNNPELHIHCQRKNKIKPEWNQLQIKIVPVNEIATNKDRENVGYQINNNNPELNVHSQKNNKIKTKRKKAQIKTVPIKETKSQQQTSQIEKCTKEKGQLLKKEKEKPKPKTREEVLAKKREYMKQRYQIIKNNPELILDYQRKNKIKYENRRLQKRILLINEMTPRQKKTQRAKWRAERNRRYQRIKDKMKERQSVAENNVLDSGVYPVQLLVIKRTKNFWCEL